MWSLYIVRLLHSCTGGYNKKGYSKLVVGGRGVSYHFLLKVVTLADKSREFTAGWWHKVPYVLKNHSAQQGVPNGFLVKPPGPADLKPSDTSPLWHVSECLCFVSFCHDTSVFLLSPFLGVRSVSQNIFWFLLERIMSSSKPALICLELQHPQSFWHMFLPLYRTSFFQKAQFSVTRWDSLVDRSEQRVKGHFYLLCSRCHFSPDGF